MYIRFESRTTGDGLFGVMSWLDMNREILRRRDRHVFDTLCDWLCHQTRKPSASVYPNKRAITWWVPTASEHIDQAWRMCALMNRNGISMRPIRAHRLPGRTTYRDEMQVVIVASPRQLDAVRGGDPRAPRREPKTVWNGDRTTIRKWRRGAR